MAFCKLKMITLLCCWFCVRVHIYIYNSFKKVALCWAFVIRMNRKCNNIDGWWKAEIYYYQHFNLVQHGIVCQKMDKESWYKTKEEAKVKRQSFVTIFLKWLALTVRKENNKKNSKKHIFLKKEKGKQWLISEWCN